MCRNLLFLCLFIDQGKKGKKGKKGEKTHVIKKLFVKTQHCGHGKLTSWDRCYRIGYSADLELVGKHKLFVLLSNALDIFSISIKHSFVL